MSTARSAGGMSTARSAMVRARHGVPWYAHGTECRWYEYGTECRRYECGIECRWYEYGTECHGTRPARWLGAVCLGGPWMNRWKEGCNASFWSTDATSAKERDQNNFICLVDLFRESSATVGVPFIPPVRGSGTRSLTELGRLFFSHYYTSKWLNGRVVDLLNGLVINKL